MALLCRNWKLKFAYIGSRVSKKRDILLSLCPRMIAEAKIPGQTSLFRDKITTWLSKKMQKNVKIVKKMYFFPSVPQHGISLQNPVLDCLGLSLGKMSKSLPGTARFWACPIVPLSWDNERTSVPLSHGTRKSGPVGNTNWNHFSNLTEMLHS